MKITAGKKLAEAGDQPSKINVKKNTDMNMAEIACFLSLLMGLRSHKTSNQGNKYMEMCITKFCINICNLFHERVRG